VDCASLEVLPPSLDSFDGVSGCDWSRVSGEEPEEELEEESTLRRRCDGAIAREIAKKKKPRCCNELGDPRIVVLGMCEACEPEVEMGVRS